jgi:predicted Zn-ribbon and HTH transcriptional regulator
MMDKILVAGYTVQDAMLLVGTGIGILILAAILKKIFKKDKVNPYMQVANCNECGWQGQVSRHAGRCPGCNMPLGDRMITRPPAKEGQVAGT